MLLNIWFICWKDYCFKNLCNYINI